MRASKRQWVFAWVWAAIVVLAAVRSYSTVQFEPRASAPKQPEAVSVALVLHTQGRFADPFATLPTGPTAHVAPGFPAMLAAIYWLFGTGAWGVFVPKLLEATVLMLQVALIPLVATALGADRITGFIAAMLAIGGMRHTWIWEANYVGLLLLVATLLACKLLNSERRETLAAWLLGVVWGVVLLTGPNAGSVWLVWVLAGAWLARRRRLWLAWLPLAVVPVVMVLPWIGRNYTVFHRFIPVRGNMGLELAVGNSPCAKVSYLQSRTTGCFQHPYALLAEAQKMARMGEAGYNRVRLQEAITWIEGNPARAMDLWIRRAGYFWFPSLNERAEAGKQRWSGWVINFVTVLALPGLLLLWKRSRTGTAICAIFVGVYPAIYYIVQFIERYRLPILWVTFLLSSVAIKEAAFWVAARLRTPARALLPEREERLVRAFVDLRNP